MLSAPAKFKRSVEMLLDHFTNDVNLYISQRKRPTATATIDENDLATTKVPKKWKKRCVNNKTMRNGPKTVQNGPTTIRKRIENDPRRSQNGPKSELQKNVMQEKTTPRRRYFNQLFF